MARKYKRKLGARLYAGYTAEQLQQCLEDIHKKRLTQRQASEKYNIPRSTIVNKLKGKRLKSIGGQTIFTPEEEMGFKNYLIQLTDLGFPITEHVLRDYIQSYLEKSGRIIRKFKNNRPGMDWVKSFLGRQPELSTIFSSSMKRVQTAISKEMIDEYLINLENEAKDIPPALLGDRNATHLQADSEERHVLCPRGAKFLEQLCDNTKTLSLAGLLAGTTAGGLLPQVMWDAWRLNGSSDAQDNGWFESATFEDWFMKQMLTKLKYFDGHWESLFRTS